MNTPPDAGPNDFPAHWPMQVGKPDLARRLAYLGLTEADAERLRSMAPIYRRHASAIVNAFYDHLYAFPVTAGFLGDPAVVARLKKVQRKHFESVFLARWDDQFVDDRVRVGQAHADVGIQPEWFLGAYNQYVQHFIAHLDEDIANADTTAQLISSFMKAVFLDVELALSAYFSQTVIQLRRALDMLSRANTDLRRFAQLTSHDLKTPIATVANLCDEALDEFGDEMPEGASELITSAKERAFGMGRLIDALLTASIVPESTVSCDEVSTELVIRRVVERLRPTWEKKKIEVRLPEAYPVVWCNEVRLREALYNLLSNAVKFINRSRGQVTISTQSEERGTTITVADNGPGIPAEELQRIFLPFRRLAQHRDSPGSGLGLFFAKSMIEDQGGHVWAESSPGQGSQFSILLPKRTK
jgi:signal transduction histidine kinase